MDNKDAMSTASDANNDAAAASASFGDASVAPSETISSATTGTSLAGDTSVLTDNTFSSDSSVLTNDVISSDTSALAGGAISSDSSTSSDTASVDAPFAASPIMSGAATSPIMPGASDSNASTASGPIMTEVGGTTMPGSAMPTAPVVGVPVMNSSNIGAPAQGVKPAKGDAPLTKGFVIGVVVGSAIVTLIAAVLVNFALTSGLFAKKDYVDQQLKKLNNGALVEDESSNSGSSEGEGDEPDSDEADRDREARNEQRSDDLYRFLTAVAHFQTNNSGKTPWEDFPSTDRGDSLVQRYIDSDVSGVRNGFIAENCGDRFMDPDGTCYGFSAHLYDGAADSDGNIFNSILEGDPHLVHVVTGAKCGDYKQLVKGPGKRNVAMFMYSPDEQLYVCADNF